MTALSEHLIAAATARWNALIPKRALLVEHVPTENPTHVRYLHPTKGWRLVSYMRLGIEASRA